MRKLKKYKPTKFKAKTSTYNKELADYAVAFIESLCHTKGTWAGHPFRTDRLAGTDHPGSVRDGKAQWLPAVQHGLYRDPQEAGKAAGP
jgi:hypothetical protein